MMLLNLGLWQHLFWLIMSGTIAIDLVSNFNSKSFISLTPLYLYKQSFNQLLWEQILSEL